MECLTRETCSRAMRSARSSTISSRGRRGTRAYRTSHPSATAYRCSVASVISPLASVRSASTTVAWVTPTDFASCLVVIPRAWRTARSQPELGRDHGTERQGPSTVSSCCRANDRSMTCTPNAYILSEAAYLIGYRLSWADLSEGAPAGHGGILRDSGVC